LFLPISKHSAGGDDLTLKVRHAAEHAQAGEGLEKRHILRYIAALEPSRFLGEVFGDICWWVKKEGRREERGEERGGKEGRKKCRLS